jgi:prevent-host-death family protein
MPEIRPITDLRDTNTISELCHNKKEPVFITKNGYGDLVVMSIETYEDLLEERATDYAIAEAAEEYKAGAPLIDAKSALKKLRRRHGA